MNDTSNLLTSVFLGSTEDRQTEFKEGFNWEAEGSAKLKEELIKAILAMSNTPVGGTIILGIRSDSKQKKIFPEGLSLKDSESFIKNNEQIKTVVHGYCQRPIDFDIQKAPHPEDKDLWFVIFQVREFTKWPTITAKPGNSKENDGKTNVIENHAIYTRSKLAQWGSIKAGPQEIEDIIETAVRKYDVHVQSLGYIRVRPRDQEIESWFSNHEAKALKDLQSFGATTYMEVLVKPIDSEKEFNKTELRDAARESTISTFGWPIGVFIDSVEDYKPVAETDGIKAELVIERQPLDDSRTFDYWAIHTSGAFFTLKSIFEDLRDPSIVSFNTRIVRVTEVLMYLRNLYGKLGLGANQQLEVTIVHNGIKGRKLGTLSQNRLMLGAYKASGDKVTTTVALTIEDFNRDPSGTVEKFTEPLFEIFDFYKVDRKILEEIVNNYLVGKVT